MLTLGQTSPVSVGLVGLTVDALWGGASVLVNMPDQPSDLRTSLCVRLVRDTAAS